jgi:hypothetical protein
VRNPGDDKRLAPVGGVATDGGTVEAEPELSANCPRFARIVFANRDNTARQSGASSWGSIASRSPTTTRSTTEAWLSHVVLLLLNLPELAGPDQS